MSENQNQSQNKNEEKSKTYSREVAVRMFAEELQDVSEIGSVKREGSMFDTKFGIVPTGGNAGRVLICGALYEVENRGDETPFYYGRVSDPTGSFRINVGQYQPEALSALHEMEVPAFVAIVGKLNTYKPENSTDVITSVRPESITVIDEETRNHWVEETLALTRERLANPNLDESIVEKYTEMVKKVESALSPSSSPTSPAPAESQNEAGSKSQSEELDANGLTNLQSAVLESIPKLGNGKLVGVPSIAKHLGVSNDDVDTQLRALSRKGLCLYRQGLVQLSTEFESATNQGQVTA
ncbi:MAG: hypothetical protein Q7J10_03005 [Methanosarcinaceae archaeon]|nr:hypothetical protein [Methanosarcinaceae archaeon]